MRQNATVAYDFEKKVLTISGELLPDGPHVHDLLAQFVGDDPVGEARIDNIGDKLSYSATFANVTAASIAATELKSKIAELQSELTSAEAQIATDATVIANLKAELAAVPTPPPATDQGDPDAPDPSVGTASDHPDAGNLGTGTAEVSE